MYLKKKLKNSMKTLASGKVSQEPEEAEPDAEPEAEPEIEPKERKCIVLSVASEKVTYLVFRKNELIAFRTVPKHLSPDLVLREYVRKFDKIENLQNFSLAKWSKSNIRGSIDIVADGSDT